MFTCSCGQEVRAIYYPDENQYMPDDQCQDCYDNEHGIISRSITNDMTEDDLPF